MGLGPLLALLSWMPVLPSGSSLAVPVRDGDLVGRVQLDNPWCGSDARLSLTLTNVGSDRLWLTLEEPAEGDLEPLHYSYSQDLQVQTTGGVACGGDGPLAFLRGSAAATLGPGQSKTWKVRLSDLDFRRGRGKVEMTIDFFGTSDRDSDHIDTFVLTPVVHFSLRRTRRCFRATPRGAG
jgi:hypothetical protein